MEIYTSLRFAIGLLVALTVGIVLFFPLSYLYLFFRNRKQYPFQAHLQEKTTAQPQFEVQSKENSDAKANSPWGTHSQFKFRSYPQGK